MNLKELKTALANAAAPTEDLLREVYDYCHRRKDIPNNIFSSLPPMVRAAWETLAATIPFERKDASASIDSTNDLINATFYVVRNTEDKKSHSLYPVRDAEKKLLATPIEYDGINATDKSNVGLALNDTLSAIGEPPRFLEDKVVTATLQAYFMTDKTTHPMPKLYAQPRDPVYCLSRREVEPDYTMKMPDWDRYLSGFEDGEAYAAKIYAIVTGKDTSRQALVTRSVGKTGKSCATEAITSIYNNQEVAKAITGTHVSQSSRFLASNYRNAALIYAPDCNVKTFLLSEVVKQLTGSDMIQYEIKGGAYGQYKATAKLIVNMNPRPLVLSDTHSRSRILYLEQGSIPYSDIGSAAFTGLLKAQLPAFLAYGEKAFATRWDAATQTVKLNARAQATFDNLAGGERQEFYDFLLTRFEFDPDLSLDGEDFTRALNKQSLSQHQRDEWREWLETMEEIEKIKAARGKVTFHGIGRKGARKSSGAAGAMTDA